MASFNKVILLGNLTAAPELRQSPGGLAVTKFTLAVNERTTSKTGTVKEEVGFFDVTVFGKQAENCANYLAKGRSVLVEGRLRLNRWETPEGQKRSKVEIIANTVQFLGSKGGSEATGATPEEDVNIMDDLPPDQDIPF